MNLNHVCRQEGLKHEVASKVANSQSNISQFLQVALLKYGMIELQMRKTPKKGVTFLRPQEDWTKWLLAIQSTYCQQSKAFSGRGWSLWNWVGGYSSPRKPRCGTFGIYATWRSYSNERIEPSMPWIQRTNRNVHCLCREVRSLSLQIDSLQIGEAVCANMEQETVLWSFP